MPGEAPPATPVSRPTDTVKMKRGHADSGTPSATAPSGEPSHARDLAACCVDVYSHPVARWLFGESFHPGGLALTQRVARLAGVGSTSRVLDLGSGRGASAVHLAETLGCEVTGVTLEATGVEAGQHLAADRGVGHLVEFRRGDIQELPLGARAYDVAMMECVLSILPAKAETLSRVRAALKPGGMVVVTDVTVSGPLPEELRGILTVAGCVGDARSLDGYARLMSDAGLDVRQVEDLQSTATSVVRTIKGKLLMAELASKLGKLPLDAALIERAKALLRGVQRLIDDGLLSYGLLIEVEPRRG